MDPQKISLLWSITKIAIGVSVLAFLGGIPLKFLNWRQRLFGTVGHFVATFLGLAASLALFQFIGILGLVGGYYIWRFTAKTISAVWVRNRTLPAKVEKVYDLSDQDGLSDAFIRVSCITEDGYILLLETTGWAAPGDTILVSFTESLINGVRWNFKQVAR